MLRLLDLLTSRQYDCVCVSVDGQLAAHSCKRRRRCRCFSSLFLLRLNGCSCRCWCQARADLSNELQQRTELEIFLRQCIEDVRQDIARKRSDVLARTRSAATPAAAAGSGARAGPETVDSDGTVDNAGGVPLVDFSTADREKVLELLLSQERVVNLLYAKTFPEQS